MSVEIPQQDVMIVTGMSGAGRSTVGNALEDLGWYVVDNLPPQMLKPLVELAGRAGTSLPKIAAVVDVRGGDFFSELRDILRTFGTGPRLRVLFLGPPTRRSSVGSSRCAARIRSRATARCSTASRPSAPA